MLDSTGLPTLLAYHMRLSTSLWQILQSIQRQVGLSDCTVDLRNRFSHLRSRA